MTKNKEYNSPMTKNNEYTVTVAEAARKMFVFESYIHALIRAGKLSAKKTAGVWRLKRDEVDAYAERLAIRRGRVPKSESAA